MCRSFVLFCATTGLIAALPSCSNKATGSNETGPGEQDVSQSEVVDNETEPGKQDVSQSEVIDVDSVSTRLRIITDSDTSNEYICDDETGPYYDCVKVGTDEQYSCKITEFEEGTPDLYICSKKEESSTPWSPPCDDYHFFGDHKSGLECWEPPANYCKNGCSTMVFWFCKTDGQKCCFASCDCFRCGWVQMLDCKIAGSNEVLTSVECDALKASLSAELRDCVATSNPGPNCDAIVNDSECQIDTTEVFCP